MSCPGPDQSPPTRLRRTLSGAAWPLRRARTFEQRVVLAGAGAARSVAAEVRWPFERLAWGAQRRLIWPLDDCFAGLGWPARVVLGVLLLGGVTSGSLAVSGLAGPPGFSLSGEPVAHSTSAGPPEPQPPAVLRAPDLSGPAPSFGAGETTTSAAVKSAGVSTDGEATTRSATDSDSAASASPATPAPAGRGVVSGEVPVPALAVARRFAEAFVLYEVGEAGPAVRRAFRQTAVPALTGLLINRPPRQPAAAEAPLAKVLNVVPGPRYGRTASVSVALMRLGATSELRLRVQRTGSGWRVKDVRG